MPSRTEWGARYDAGMTNRSRLGIAILLVTTALVACGDPTPPTHAPAVPTQLPDTSSALKALFEELAAFAKAGDRDALARSGRTLLPTRDELRRVLRPGPETDTWLAAYKGPTAESPPPPSGAPSVETDTRRSEIHVHAATTEELVAYVRGSVAWKAFPGGMRRFAERIAAPGRTWYAVEAREPGKDSGTRLTCFTHVGARFVLVAKPWRALPAAPKAATDEGPR